jgi:hypothetical protein
MVVVVVVVRKKGRRVLGKERTRFKRGLTIPCRTSFQIFHEAVDGVVPG